MKTFRDIKGQDRAVSLLQRAYKNETISHAYLFIGPSGVGKSLVAKSFIKLINCESVSADFNPCNQCSSCLEIIENKFLDLIHIKPASTKEVIKIDLIRKIEEQISYKNFKGNQTIVLIEQIEQMNLSSANALLKTLEEPPPNTIFILTSVMEHLLPATIRSRCQLIIFSPLPTDFIFKQLQERYLDEIPSNRLHLIAKLSQGSMTNSFNFIEQKNFEVRTEFLNTVLKNKQQRLPVLVKWISEHVLKFKGDQFYKLLLVLEFFKTVIRDALILQLTGDETRLINTDYIQQLQELATHSPDFLEQQISLLNQLQHNIQSNMNTEMALLGYFIAFVKGEN